MFRKYMETCCSEQFGDHGDANRIVDNEQTLRTNETVQGNLLHYYERKFANLPGHL